MFSPNSVQHQKRKKKQTLLSVSVFSIERARELLSSPTAFFFFTFLLKRRHERLGKDLQRSCGPISLLKAQSLTSGSCWWCPAAFQTSTSTETSQGLSATCMCAVPAQIFAHIDNNPLNFLFCSLNSPILSHQDHIYSPNHLSDPFQDSPQYVNVLESAGLDRTLRLQSCQGWAKVAEVTPPSSHCSGAIPAQWSQSANVNVKGCISGR